MNALEEVFGEVIYAYTRKQAIEDGTLVDVTKMAKEAGFKIPVAVTSALWNRIQNVPKSKYGGDSEGRLWDVLWMAFIACKRSKGDEPGLIYQLILPHMEVIQDKDNQLRNQLYINQNLKAVIGPGDVGEPVITIMLPDED